MLTLVRGRTDRLRNLMRGLARQTVPPRELVIAWMQPEPAPDLPDPGCPVRHLFVAGEPMPLAAARNRAAEAAAGIPLAGSALRAPFDGVSDAVGRFVSDQAAFASQLETLATWLGWLVDRGAPVTLVGSTPDQVARAQRELVRIGVDRPAAAATGARIRDVLSPTPPVLCLSTFRPGVPERSTTVPDRVIASVRAAVSSGLMPRQTIAISSADHW